MFSLLQAEKAKLAAAKATAQSASLYYQRRVTHAKIASKNYLASPKGILSVFSVGMVKGAVSEVPKPPSSIIQSVLLKLL